MMVRSVGGRMVDDDNSFRDACSLGTSQHSFESCEFIVNGTMTNRVNLFCLPSVNFRTLLARLAVSAKVARQAGPQESQNDLN